MESSMRLTSSAFADGAMIPRRFTCDGQGLSPPLAWADVPNNVRSFVLLCDDPDAPGGTWHHWAVYDIPEIVQCFLKVLRRAMTVLNKQLTTSAASVMVGRALHAATGLTTITFDSWRYPSAR
jgi:Raf kinase inhibitor-like YbhB/YbcL family protein